jgi:hypothetical protein
MADVGFVANLESSPSRVRDPTVFFGLPFLKQSVADGTRKWNINGSVRVHMSDLRFPKSEFFTPEPMRVSGDTRPRRNLAFQPSYIVHIPILVIFDGAESTFDPATAHNTRTLVVFIHFIEAAGAPAFVFKGWGD